MRKKGQEYTYKVWDNREKTYCADHAGHDLQFGSERVAKEWLDATDQDSHVKVYEFVDGEFSQEVV